MARPEGPEGGAQRLTVTSTAGVLPTTASMSTLESEVLSTGTHRNHSIPSLICRDASTIYRNLSPDNPLPSKPSRVRE